MACYAQTVPFLELKSCAARQGADVMYQSRHVFLAPCSSDRPLRRFAQQHRIYISMLKMYTLVRVCITHTQVPHRSTNTIIKSIALSCWMELVQKRRWALKTDKKYGRRFGRLQKGYSPFGAGSCTILLPIRRKVKQNKKMFLIGVFSPLNLSKLEQWSFERESLSCLTATTPA